MKITITAPGEYLVDSKDEPIVGRSYNLEDAATGTGAQNRAFHALVSEFFVSGCSSYDANNLDDFRNCIKRSLGAGFEAYVYIAMVNGKPEIRDAVRFEDVPLTIRLNWDLKKLVRGRLKSWTNYTKRERRETLDKLIAEMRQSGVNSKKFQEIIEGMERE